MRSFRDTKDRLWDLSIDIAAVRRVKALTGIVIPDLVGEKLESLSDLIGDPLRLVDVCFAIVKPKADDQKVSDESFAEGLAGDTIEQMADAFVEAVVHFFPNARTRQALVKAVAAWRKIREKVETEAVRDADSIDVEKMSERIISKARGEATKSLNALYADSPGHSASTPPP